jgi:very-short-patch-repair endonuclease
MTGRNPTPAPAGHPLPQGERERESALPQGEREEKVSRLRPVWQVAKEQQERRRQNLPSPLAGEGAPEGRERGLTPEEFAKLQAKRLRLNMTDAEIRLWHALRATRFESYKFRRQVAIGRYIVDFVCYGARVIVEVDGSQHEASLHDQQRDAWLVSQGFQIVRVWNNDVLMAMDGVLLKILQALRHPAPAPAGHPLPQGEREAQDAQRRERDV